MIPLWLIPLFPLAGTIVLALIAVASSDSKKGPDEGLVGFLGVLFPLPRITSRFSMSSIL